MLTLHGVQDLDCAPVCMLTTQALLTLPSALLRTFESGINLSKPRGVCLQRTNSRWELIVTQMHHDT